MLIARWVYDKGQENIKFKDFLCACTISILRITGCWALMSYQCQKHDRISFNDLFAFTFSFLVNVFFRKGEMQCAFAELAIPVTGRTGLHHPISFSLRLPRVYLKISVNLELFLIRWNSLLVETSYRFYFFYITKVMPKIAPHCVPILGAATS